jgi:SAM-dependent methyltransferase
MGEATSIVNPALAEVDTRGGGTQGGSAREHRSTMIDDQPTIIDDDGVPITSVADQRLARGLPTPSVEVVSLDAPVDVPARPSRTLPLLRRQSGDPDEFYRYLAQDTVRHVRQHLSLDGARAIDIGSGPGYVADELQAAGARSCVVGYSTAELFEGGRHPESAVLGDCQALPLASNSMQVVHSANVLEHVSLPYSMLAEMVRVLEPHDGIGYLTFTNWYSPFGHEPAPWHSLVGHRSARRLDPRTVPPVQVDHPLHVSDVLRWFEARRDVDVLWSGPRYLPPWLRWIVAVPGVREALSWNLVVVFRKHRRR